MDKALNIAHCVESYEPAKGGMPEVVKQLSERMARAGHTVTVFTSVHPERKSETINGVHVRSFALSGNAVDGITSDTQAYFDALQQGNFDVVAFFAAQQWATDAVIGRLKEIPGKKVFVPTGFSHFQNPAYASYFQSMKTWLHDFDTNVFLSDDYQDINFARENGVKGITIIPNGAAEEEFEKAKTADIRAQFDVAPDDLLLLHVGTFTGVKGHREALEIFIRSSLKNATLLLAGNKTNVLEAAFRKHYRYAWLRLLAWLRGKKIIFAELSRSETVEAFREADLFFFPSNIECSPIVLFESMAAGVPFLASPAGNTAEIIGWGHGGWLLPGNKTKNGWVRINIAESVKQLEKTAADRRALKAAGASGHKAWKAQFTWAIIARRYLQLYTALVNG